MAEPKEGPLAGRTNDFGPANENFGQLRVAGWNFLYVLRTTRAARIARLFAILALVDFLLNVSFHAIALIDPEFKNRLSQKLAAIFPKLVWLTPWIHRSELISILCLSGASLLLYFDHRRLHLIELSQKRIMGYLYTLAGTEVEEGGTAYADEEQRLKAVLGGALTHFIDALAPKDRHDLNATILVSHVDNGKRTFRILAQDRKLDNKEAFSWDKTIPVNRTVAGHVCQQGDDLGGQYMAYVQWTKYKCGSGFRFAQVDGGLLEEEVNVEKKMYSPVDEESRQKISCLLCMQVHLENEDRKHQNLCFRQEDIQFVLCLSSPRENSLKDSHFVAMRFTARLLGRFFRRVGPAVTVGPAKTAETAKPSSRKDRRRRR